MSRNYDTANVLISLIRRYQNVYCQVSVELYGFGL